ncbi:MAG: hypothetical protein HYY14_00155 [Candidatus Omnitrophica bacterium]|nr:hypothetical protein [Candidatus Omnitrophota bacterium]
MRPGRLGRVFVGACVLASAWIAPLAGQEGADAIHEAPGQPGKLSLELKGMDILDVLRLLSIKSGLNIVAGANVRGRVTLFLKEVDPWDAFVIILETNNLAYEIKNDIIKVMTDRDYELLYGDRFQDKTRAELVEVQHANVTDIATALNQAKTKIGKVITDPRSSTVVLIDIPDRIEQMKGMVEKMDVPTETHVYKLSYGKVEDIVPEVEKVLTENIGKIKSDERTNKIAVTDLPERFPTISKLVEEFDEKTAEVLIEAKIIEITLSDDYAFGIDWNVFAQALQSKFAPTLPFFDADLDFNAGSGGLSTLSFARGDVTTVVEALKTFGQTNTLSSPRLLVANNQEARILIGADEAFVTQQTVVSSGGSNTSDEVQFVEVGTKLGVTPTVNRDGFVTIKIKPEVSSVARTLVIGATNTTSNTTAQQTARTTVPIIATSEAETTVVVKDGHTVIIGGLIKDTENVDMEEVPFLGGLPFVGGLFRSEDREIDKSELVIFVTPHIVTGEEEFFSYEGSGVGPKEREELMARSVYGAVPEAAQAPEPPVEMKEEKADSVQAAHFRYEDFLRRRILDALSHLLPQAHRAGEVRVSFVLSRDGYLVGEPYIQTRRNELLDPLVIQSVKGSSPFPPFADDMPADQETFTIAIAFQ